MTKNEYKEKIIELCNQPPTEYALDWFDKAKSYEMKVIFGGGQLGSMWIDLWESYNIKPDYIVDNNKDCWGKTLKGIQCISPDDLLKLNKKTLILLAVRDYRPIYEQLLNMEGLIPEDIIVATIDTKAAMANYTISKGKMNINDFCKGILKVVDICEDEYSAKILYQTVKRYLYNKDELIDYSGVEYFIPEIERSEHEIFVDAGAYDGDTLELFLKVYNKTFNKYYAFELDEANYKNLCNKVAELPDNVREKVIIYNIGLWSEKQEITYDSCKTTTSIGAPGSNKGIVDKLDNVLREEKVTFIKMDIEGAEMEALKGCVEHICQYKPILAICIYHSIYDLVNIPLMLKEFGYKIIIRHHATLTSDEIVCYAYD